MRMFFLALLSVFMFCNAECQTYSISGKVLYKNAVVGYRTLDSTTVDLYQGTVLLASVTTTTGGDYFFGDLQPGTYELRLGCPKMWGGGGSNDALAILRHFVGLPPLLTGLYLTAADLTADGIRNAVDGMLVSRRFVGAISSFPSGDWCFENPVVTVANASISLDIFGLCFGDVNGSNIPMGSTIP